MAVRNTLRFIAGHPLNADHPLRALRDYARWQIALRAADAPVLVPWVDDSVLLVSRGMHGATGNLYCGLHEMSGMGFLLHFLRDEELFVDIGANVGTYTVLATRVCGGRAIAVEPVPSTFTELARNVSVNGVDARVELRRVGISDCEGRLSFTTDDGPMNRVVSGVHQGSQYVDVVTLDELVGDRSPTFIKVDVEGWETHVVAGGERVLADEHLRACLIEITDSVPAFGRPVPEVMADHGFRVVAYDPITRELTEPHGPEREDANVLFVRDPASVQVVLRSSPARRVRGRDL